MRVSLDSRYRRRTRLSPGSSNYNKFKCLKHLSKPCQIRVLKGRRFSNTAWSVRKLAGGRGSATWQISRSRETLSLLASLFLKVVEEIKPVLMSVTSGWRDRRRAGPPPGSSKLLLKVLQTPTKVLSSSVRRWRRVSGSPTCQDGRISHPSRDSDPASLPLNH